MPLTALWDVSSGQPSRLQPLDVALERHLEDWIDADPAMLPGNLQVIARQLYIDAGRLDLLAIDAQGVLHVVEIKRGTLNRDTVAQGIDYAACLEQMDTDELVRRIDEQCAVRHGRSVRALLTDRNAETALDFDERAVAIMIVGLGRDPGLERVVTYLSQRDVDITIVSFEGFTDSSGRQILSREVSSDEPSRVNREPTASVGLGDLRSRAAEGGIGRIFDTIIDAGLAANLHYRVYRNSVMFSPPNMKYRALFTVWVQPKDGRVRLWIGNKVFEDYFPRVTADATARELGVEGWHTFDEAAATSFASGLTSLLSPTV